MKVIIFLLVYIVIFLLDGFAIKLLHNMKMEFISTNVEVKMCIWLSLLPIAQLLPLIWVVFSLVIIIFNKWFKYIMK